MDGGANGDQRAAIVAAACGELDAEAGAGRSTSSEEELAGLPPPASIPPGISIVSGTAWRVARLQIRNRVSRLVAALVVTARSPALVVTE